MQPEKTSRKPCVGPSRARSDGVPQEPERGCQRGRGPWRSFLIAPLLAAAPSAPWQLAEARDASPPLPYDLAAPAASFELPPVLTEISALTDLDEHTVACLQDELGTVFHVDVRSGEVTRSLGFGPDGDYEGLTRVGPDLWVLRSDGWLLELVPASEAGHGVQPGRELQLDIAHEDVEGLGYDPVEGVILVAPKDPPKGPEREKLVRRLFAVDPATGQQLARIPLETSVDRVVADAARLGIELPSKTTRKGKTSIALGLRLSSLAVHPRTGEIYLLSAQDAALLVVDRDGHLRAAELLDRERFPQAEGMTFLPSGDLVLASEGAPARLEVFTYTPPAAAPAEGR